MAGTARQERPVDAPTESPRIRRERRTVMAMIQLSCRLRHGTDQGLCASCAALQAYALERLARCPFAPDKPTCAQCPVHCYAKEPRAQIREVMGFAGPRMMLHHPLLALLHLWDGRRSAHNRKK